MMRYAKIPVTSGKERADGGSITHALSLNISLSLLPGYPVAKSSRRSWVGKIVAGSNT